MHVKRKNFWVIFTAYFESYTNAIAGPGVWCFCSLDAGSLNLIVIPTYRMLIVRIADASLVSAGRSSARYIASSAHA